MFGSETEFGMYVVDCKGQEISHSSVSPEENYENSENDEENSHGKMAVLYNDIGAMVLEDIGLNVAENDGFLSNGGRLYYDMNALEYATPECSTAEDVVLHELAGEKLILRFMEKLQGIGLIDSYQVNKRSTDHVRNSWGSHENVSILDDKIYKSPDKLIFLASHYLTRSIYTGAGGIVANHYGQKRYAISPRLFATHRLKSVSRIHNPLVCTNLTVEAGGYRGQQSNAEANSSPWVIKMRHATNSLVYRLIEEDSIPEHLFIVNPERHTQNVALKTGLDSRVPIFYRNKKITINPVEWQSALAEYCQDLKDKIDFSDDETWAISQILEVCDDLTHRQEETLNRVEWVARKRYLEERADGQPKITDRSLKLDFLWDALGFGHASRLRDKGWGWHGFHKRLTPHDIDRAVFSAPVDTRAAIRANYILNRSILVADWDKVTVQNGEETWLETMPLK